MKKIYRLLKEKTTHFVFLKGHPFADFMHRVSIALVLKMLGAGLAFSLNVVLARLIGADGVGVYYLATGFVLVVSTLGRCGFEKYLIRNVSIIVSEKHDSNLKTIYRKVMGISLKVSLALTVIIVIFREQISHDIFSRPEFAVPLFIAAIALMPYSLLVLNSQALIGLKKIRDSLLVSSVIVPLVAIILVFLLTPYFGINGALISFTVSVISACFYGLWRWSRSTVNYPETGNTVFVDNMLSSSMPMLLVNIFNQIIVWGPVLIMGFFSTDSNIGEFGVASRTALLISFILISVNSVSAPKFAELYEKGELNELFKNAKSATRVMTFASLPILFIFILFPGLVMSLFGRDFEDGAFILSILAVGQFVNVITGSVGVLLLMSGREKVLRNITGVSAALLLVMLFILVPVWGGIGAAVSVTFVVSLQNILATWVVRKEFGKLLLPI